MRLLSLALDPSGRVVLSGYTLSTNFPVTSSAFQTKYGGNTDAFISVLDTAKGELVYSTYFGGAGTSTRRWTSEGGQQRCPVCVRIYGVAWTAIYQQCSPGGL